MSKTEKLFKKLESGTVDGDELLTLLGRSGWYPLRQKGSHQTWSNGSDMMIIIAGRNQLKPYQIKEAQKILLKRKEENK